MVRQLPTNKFQGLFKDKLLFKGYDLFNKSTFFNPLLNTLLAKHVMESLAIFTSSAMVDHIILYYFPQQRFVR